MSHLSEFLKRKKRRPSAEPFTKNKPHTLVKDKAILAASGYFIGRKLDSGTFATVRYAEKSTNNGTVPLAVKVSLNAVNFIVSLNVVE